MLRGHTWLLGFFGEGLPRMAAWRVPENAARKIVIRVISDLIYAKNRLDC